MHLTRSETLKKLPIARKGTRYIVRTAGYVHNSVSVLVAIRDMLKLARTAREVQEMIKAKQIKLNGRIVRDYRAPICLFNVLEAHKKYRLSIAPTGRFTLVETKDAARLARVMSKILQPKGVIQYNLHDGTNLITKEKLIIGDSVELDVSNKIVKVISLEKAKKVFIYTGKNKGHEASVKSLSDGKITLTLGDRSVTLGSAQVIAL